MASLAVFRMGFGLLMAWELTRYLVHGWVGESYVEPAMHFPMLGFAWIPAPGAWVYGLYVLLILCALCIALGVAYRVSAAIMALGYGYVLVCDQSYYLNHHYLVVLLAGILVFLPADRFWSLRARKDPEAETRIARRYPCDTVLID